MAHNLTDAAVRKYAPGPKRRRIPDGGIQSLFLVVEPSGHKSFQMRFRTPSGRIGKVTLGPYTSARELKGDPEIGQPLTLAAARMLAAEVHRQRALGHDIIADHHARKRRQRAEIEHRDRNTFPAAVRDYIAEHAQKQTRGWRWTARLLGLQYGDDDAPETIRGGLCERWGDRPLDAIDEHDIWTVIDEARRIGVPGIKARNTGLSEPRARGLFVAVSSFFGWARQQRRIGDNPCAGVSRPKNAEARDRVLSSDEIRWFWRACDSIDIDARRSLGAPRPLFGPLLKLLLLTGSRVDEVAGMTRGELSGDGAVWNLPGSRTKNKRAHMVPLAAVAGDLIASVQSDGELVFSTTGGRSPPSGFSKVKARLDRLMLAAARAERGKDATIEPWRLHDLRRSFVTHLAELGVPPHVIEMAVNHVSGTRSGVAGTYNRSQLLPERKAALERWAAHITGLTADRSNIVEMKQGGGAKWRKS